MNSVQLMGRLVKDPEVRYSPDGMAIGRYTLAVDRYSKNNENQADFISIVAFGKNAEFAEKYLAKGTKIAIQGNIKTGSYTNKDGNKVYTTDVIVERHFFCEKSSAKPKEEEPKDEIPEGFAAIDEDDMPF